MSLAVNQNKLMHLKRRVVVTGMGIVSPLGIGLDNNWAALSRGQSGIGPVTRFDTTDSRTKIAGEVKDFEPTNFMEKKAARRTSRFIQFASAASRLALEDSKFVITAGNADRVGVSIATALGGVDVFEKNHKLILEGNRDKVSPFLSPTTFVTWPPERLLSNWELKDH